MIATMRAWPIVLVLAGCATRNVLRAEPLVERAACNGDGMAVYGLWPDESPRCGVEVTHLGEGCYVALRRGEHQRLEAGVEHERRHGVDQLDLEQLDRADLGERQSPRVPAAQIDLLQVLVETPFGEELRVGVVILRQERDLRKRRGVGQAGEVRELGDFAPELGRRRRRRAWERRGGP